VNRPTAQVPVRRPAGVPAGAWVIAAVVALLAAVEPAAAQPGGRLDSAQAHRAAVRAEAYSGVAAAMFDWNDAWRRRDARALARLYDAEAAARLPGQSFVRGRDPLARALRDAVAAGSRVAMTDLDFDSDGATAVLVSRYRIEGAGPPVTGIATAVLVLHRSGGWRFRTHVFGDIVAADTADGRSP
jgi:ketosteroid isomerase-like protein